MESVSADHAPCVIIVWCKAKDIVVRNRSFRPAPAARCPTSTQLPNRSAEKTHRPVTGAKLEEPAPKLAQSVYHTFQKNLTVLLSSL